MKIRNTLVVVSSVILSFTSMAADVVFSPSTHSSANVEQIRVKFPASMIEADKPFSVTCDPAVSGYGGWADNNTTWTYNLNLPKNRWGEIRPLPGGASCEVEQIAELRSGNGDVWPARSLKHKFTVKGPNVTNLYLLPGMAGELRETDPVFMIVFDGDIDQDTLFNSRSSFLWYHSTDSNPVERISFSRVPKNKVKPLFDIFNNEYYLSYRNVSKHSKNWALVTLNRNLVAGAKANVRVAGVKSAYKSAAMSVAKSFKLKVRSDFRATVRCSRLEAGSAYCMPEGQISVHFGSAKVFWNDVKSAYIEYVPQDSTNGKLVKAFPSEEGAKLSWVGWIARSLNIVPNKEMRVTSLDFSKIRVAPQTTASVVFPQGLKDVDGRQLPGRRFDLEFGSFSETIKLPGRLTILERKVLGNSALPVSVMNLNQKLTIQKTGNRVGNWEPITDMQQIINLVTEYDRLGMVSDRDYVSPLKKLGYSSSTEKVSLSGQVNLKSLLHLKFGQNSKGQKSGLYAVEIKSELSQRNRPEYNLTMVTDLNLHMKKGLEETVVWVTSYSTGMPVANSKVEIFGCNKQSKVSGVTNSDGLFKFSNAVLGKACKYRGSYLLSGSNFFVSAKTSEDMAFSHSSYQARDSWALGAPGVDYFSSDVEDNSVYIHSLVGINLVKPGQVVPVQLTATVPTESGFKAAENSRLPESVRVVNNFNSDIFYTFPLKWKNGVAEFKWDVPNSAELGSYSIKVKRGGRNWYSRLGTDIEVSEFKVPLMTASMKLAKGPLISPNSLPVSGFIQYANGVGARDQEVEFSYYFSPSTLKSDKFRHFDFSRGEYGKVIKSSSVKLPSSEQVAKVEKQMTDKSGVVSVDLAREMHVSGAPVAQILKTVSRPYDLVVRMRYKDQMGEFQTKSIGETIYNASSYVGTKITSGPLSEASLDVVTVGTNGKTYTNLSDLEINVLEIKTHIVGEEVFGGFVKNTIEKEAVPTSWTPNCPLNGEGVANCSATSLKKGFYVLQVKSKNTKQNTYSVFSVDAEGVLTGEGDFYYFDKDQKSLLLAADKPEYKGGDTAKLSFDSPFENCVALVTLERADVVETIVDKKACERGFVKANLKAENAPNIFTSVYLVTGRANKRVSFNKMDLAKPTYRLGFSNLKIDWQEYALDIDVKLDKGEYHPGEFAVANIDAKAASGKAANTKVTLVVLEEKILSLKENKSHEILSMMMGMRGHSVATMNTYRYLNSVAEVEKVEQAESVKRKAGEEGGSGSEFESFQRKLFDALVAWQSEVEVKDGKAQIQFKLNDKLAKFKVLVIANDSNRKFGTASTSYVAAQEVQSFSNIPPAARNGDEFPLIVTVQNNGKKAGKYKVEVSYTVTEKDGKTSKHSVKTGTSIQRGGSKAVNVGKMKVPKNAKSVGYTVTVTDENGTVVDRIVVDSQKILPANPLRVQSEYLVQMEKGNEVYTLVKHKNALPGEGSIESKVFNSIVKTAEFSIQKSFSEDAFVDLTIENQLLNAIVNSTEQDSGKLKSAYADLLSQIDKKGFFKYYKGAKRGNFWLTAEMVQLISMKDWAVQMMPDSIKSRLARSFKDVLTGKIGPQYISKKASADVWLAAKLKAENSLIALGMESSIPQGQDLLAQINSENDFTRFPLDTLTDAALLNAHKSPKTLMKSAVMTYIHESLISLKNTSAVLKGQLEFGWWGYADEIVSTAKLVRAQSIAASTTGLNSSENYLDNLVVGLTNANRLQKWYTNRTKAWVLSGLISFADAFEEQKVEGKTIVSSSESNISSIVIWNQGNQSNGVASSWKTEKAKVEIAHKGQGKPWVSILARSAIKLEKPNYQGMMVTKEITNMSSEDGLFRSGDLLQVKLTIETPSAANHVTLYDPIPAGANILGDGGGIAGIVQKSYSGYKGYFYYLPSGKTTIVYQYQLNNPGRFQLSPTRVEALYEPGLFGEIPNEMMEIAQ